MTIYPSHSLCVCVCVCVRARKRKSESVCVCVCEREREREREKGGSMWELGDVCLMQENNISILIDIYF